MTKLAELIKEYCPEGNRGAVTRLNELAKALCPNGVNYYAK